jgi:hypothetical protein
MKMRNAEEDNTVCFNIPALEAEEYLEFTKCPKITSGDQKHNQVALIQI